MDTNRTTVYIVGPCKKTKTSSSGRARVCGTLFSSHLRDLLLNSEVKDLIEKIKKENADVGGSLLAGDGAGGPTLVSTASIIPSKKMD